jgi:hypothetical protein
MARKGTLWLPLDVNFMDDPKILRAGEQAAWLFLAMCLFSKRVGIDGLMDEMQIARLGVPGWQKRLRALLGVELVVQLDQGYAIAAWLVHNDSADDVAEKRRRDAERKRKGRGAA